VQLMYCNWSTEGWRLYIKWLEAMIDQETLGAVMGARGLGKVRREYKPQDLQTVEHYEEKTNEAIMILEANIEVMKSLRTFYEKMSVNVAFPLTATCGNDVATFATQIEDMIYELTTHTSRAKLLVRIATNRKGLILQHLQSQATEKMEALTNTSNKEAVAMRIITVVTLVYLPATFVSTFFSTDIVKYQNQNGGGSSGSQDQSSGGASFSNIALIRWLQVTLPLTFLTLTIGYAGYKHANKSRKKSILRLPFYNPTKK